VAAAFGIRSIPTLLLIKDGKVVDQQVGAVPQARLQAMLEQQVQVAEAGVRRG
jgi:thioredoxin 1